MRPAGILSIAGVFLIAIGLALRISALNADGAADALLELNADDLGGRLLLGAIVSGLGYLCLGAPLTYIFLAASARSERVRNGLVGLSVIGVVFLAIGGVVSSAALSSAADDFAAAEAERSSAPPESSAAADAAAEKKDTAPGELGASEDEGGAAKGETTVEATTTTDRDQRGLTRPTRASVRRGRGGRGRRPRRGRDQGRAGLRDRRHPRPRRHARLRDRLLLHLAVGDAHRPADALLGLARDGLLGRLRAAGPGRARDPVLPRALVRWRSA